MAKELTWRNFSAKPSNNNDTPLLSPYPLYGIRKSLTVVFKSRITSKTESKALLNKKAMSVIRGVFHMYFPFSV